MKVDKTGRAYKVDESGRKIMWGSPRPPKVSPEEWRSLAKKKRDAYKDSISRTELAEKEKKKFEKVIEDTVEKSRGPGHSKAKPKSTLKERKKKKKKEKKEKLKNKEDGDEALGLKDGGGDPKDISTGGISGYEECIHRKGGRWC